MVRNAIRIVCNSTKNKVMYFFRNKPKEWKELPSDSPLLRSDYTNTLFVDSAKDILIKIDEIYNIKNKGIDVFFEGTTEEYEILLKTVEEVLPERNIHCKEGKIKIAIVGKKSVGKSLLIEGIESLYGITYQKIECDGYVRYSDNSDSVNFYEIAGIDIGKEKVEKAFDTLKKISEEIGLSAIIYCVSAITGKVESMEKEFILRIENDLGVTKVIIVLTMCYMDDIQRIIDIIKNRLNEIEIFPVLSKEYKTCLKDKHGATIVIEKFGLEDISQFIFGEI
ncbi:MAG: hypothetical protein ACTTHM_07260 [Peptoanaerobacter stomatis]|uniref:hypothetical protein n=1 Tax=Peptoanaerobacter stomatis TaxID=796937 RepID=UPI003FA110DA